MKLDDRPWLKSLVCVVVLVAAGTATYGQAVGFSFVTKDDHRLIRTNPHVTDWAHAPVAKRLLTPEFTYAIPVTMASWALDWQLWGGAPWGFHLTNLLLHLGCGLILWLLARRLTGDLPALGGALLLLLHPVAAETVSFVTQRKDLLATLFALLALERALTAARRSQPVRPLALTLIFAGLAGLSKPTALLVGPTVLAIYWLLAEQKVRTPSVRLIAGGLALLTPALLGLNLAVQRLHPGTLDSPPAGLGGRLMLLCHTVTHYAQSLLVPLSLSPKVPRPTLTFALQPVLACVAMLAGLAGLGAWLWKRGHRRGLTAVLWCGAAYLPVSNLIPVKRYVADSYLYLLLAGLGLGFALAFAQAQRSRDSGGPTRRRIAMIAITGALLLGLGAISHRQAAVWRDEGVLFSYLFRLYPDNAEAEAQYVAHLRRVGKTTRARAVHRDFLERAIGRRPGDLAARHHLLRLFLATGHAPRARALLEQAPGETRSKVAYWEAWLEYAMHRMDYRLAHSAVLKILALDPRSPRRKLLPELRRRLPRAP